jgi:hypothetical protein
VPAGCADMSGVVSSCHWRPDQKDLATPFGHELYPLGPVTSVAAAKASRIVVVVKTNVRPRATDLVVIGEKPQDPLVFLILAVAGDASVRTSICRRLSWIPPKRVLSGFLPPAPVVVT